MRGQSCPSEGSVGRLTRPLNSASGTVLEEVLSEIRVQSAPPAHFSLGIRSDVDGPGLRAKASKMSSRSSTSRRRTK